MKEIQSLSQYAYDFIRTICQNIGPRYSCSKEEREANEWIYAEMKTFCDESFIEDFTTHPNLFPQGIIKICFSIGLISFFLIPLSYPYSIISSSLILLGFLIYFSEMMLMVGVLQPFFKKEKSSNVYGIIKPKNEVKFRVILDGHTDSAKEMRIAGTRKPIVTIISIIFGIVYMVYTLIFPVVKIIIQSNYANHLVLYKFFIFEWTQLDLYYYIPSFLFFINYLIMFSGFIGYLVVMGANDNLSGTAVASAVGKYFSSNKLDNVELIITSTGSEEVGEKGAKEFVKKHPELFENSYSFVYECIGAGKEILVIEKDFMHLAKYSKEVIDRILEAHERYLMKDSTIIPIKSGNLLLGSSNANRYVKAGYKATFVINLDDTGSKPVNWHTRNDILENIDQKILQDMIGLTIEFVKMIDEEQNPKS